MERRKTRLEGEKSQLKRGDGGVGGLTINTAYCAGESGER